MEFLSNFLDMLNEDILFLYWMTFFLGASVGSFINVVVARYPSMMHQGHRDEINEYLEDQGIDVRVPNVESNLPKTLNGRSECPKCHVGIPLWANIPILGWFLVMGKCISCKQSISFRYPLFEIIVALLSLLVVYVNGPTTMGLLGLIFVWLMMPAIRIDMEELVLPDTLNYILLWTALVTAAQGRNIGVEEAVYGAVFGYLSLWSVYWAFKLVTGKEGMGYGDFKLMAALGAISGAMAIPYIALLAVIFSIGLVVMDRWSFNGDRAIPFGPGLAMGGFVIYLVQSGLEIPYIGFVFNMVK